MKFINYGYAKNYLLKQLEGIDKLILDELLLVAKSLIEDAHTNRGYTINTGDLITSTGCLIMRKGEVVQIVGVSGTDKGKKIAKEFSNEIAKKFSNDDDYRLILFAGMPYASILEDRGFNVLYVTTVNAQQIFTKHLNIIKNKYKKK